MVSEIEKIENNVFFNFEFNEENFKKEKERLFNLFEYAEKNNIKIFFMKNFPPCILKKNKINDCILSKNWGKPPKSSSEILSLSKYSKVISNNLFFGKSYISINKRFIHSPFISKTCKKCFYFSSGKCRGLLNKDFLKFKNSFIKNNDKKLYESIKEDFSHNLFYTGAICKKNCLFCFARFMPEDLYPSKKIMRPREILHFLHYIHDFIETAGVGTHCSSKGDFFDNPYHFEILDILSKVKNKDTEIVTHGDNLNLEILRKISKMDVILNISVHSTNNLHRKKIMGSKKIVNIKQKLFEIKRNKIRFSTSIVPFKHEGFYSDFYETIRFLLSLNPHRIHIFPPGKMELMDQNTKNSLSISIDEINDYLKKWNLNHKKVGIQDYNSVNVDIENYVTIVDNILENSKLKFLLPVTPRFKKKFERISKKNLKILEIQPSNSHDGKDMPLSLFTLHTYSNFINLYGKDCNVVILPKSIFNMNFKDSIKEDINSFWNNINKKTLFLL